MQSFETHLSELYGQFAPSELRSRAWERFRTLGLPTRKWEGYRHVPLTPLYTSAHPLAEEASSPWMPLDEAYRTYGAILKGRWQQRLKGEADPFAALNGALHTEGHFLYVPKGSEGHTFVHRPEGLYAPRMQIFVGPGAELQLDLSLETESPHWMNSVVDIALDEGARCDLRLDYTSNYLAFEAIRVTQKRSSHFTSSSWTEGGVRCDYRVALEGPEAEADLKGRWHLKRHREAHFHILVEHLAPNCRSLQLFKGALEDQSRSSFEGKIYVAAEAQQTDAFQLNQNLLLSEQASAHSKPNLQIYADEVKASHGATFGQLDREQLFYLTSRGLTPQQAAHLLIAGFLRE